MFCSVIAKMYSSWYCTFENTSSAMVIWHEVECHASKDKRTFHTNHAMTPIHVTFYVMDLIHPACESDYLCKSIRVKSKVLHICHVGERISYIELQNYRDNYAQRRRKYYTLIVIMWVCNKFKARFCVSKAQLVSVDMSVEYKLSNAGLSSLQLIINDTITVHFSTCRFIKLQSESLYKFNNNI